MIDSHDYRVDLIGVDEKRGMLTAEEDGLREMEVASPPEFGGPGRLWSPEHLLVAAVSSCLMTTFRSIASRSGVQVLDYSDNAVGHLARGDDGFYSIETITLRPRIVIGEESNLDRAERVLAKADDACLISRSVQSKVVVEPVITRLVDTPRAGASTVQG